MPWFKQDRYVQIFDQIDADKDGYISYDDLFSFLRKEEYMGPSDLINTSFKDANISGTGKVSYNEFVIAMGYDPVTGEIDFRSLRNATLRQLFIQKDKENDGTVDHKVLKDVFAELGNKVSNVELRNCTDLCDLGGTGKFDYNAYIEKLIKYKA